MRVAQTGVGLKLQTRKAEEEGLTLTELESRCSKENFALHADGYPLFSAVMLLIMPLGLKFPLNLD